MMVHRKHKRITIQEQIQTETSQKCLNLLYLSITFNYLPLFCRDEYKYPQSGAFFLEVMLKSHLGWLFPKSNILDVAAGAFCVTFFSGGNDQKISQWILPSTGPVLTKPLVKVGHWHKTYTPTLTMDKTAYTLITTGEVVYGFRDIHTMHQGRFQQLYLLQAPFGTIQSINIHKSSIGYMAIAHYGLNGPVLAPAYHLDILGHTNIRVQELTDVDKLLLMVDQSTDFWMVIILPCLAMSELSNFGDVNVVWNSWFIAHKLSERKHITCTSAGTIGICQISNSSLLLPNFSEINQPGFATRLVRGIDQDGIPSEPVRQLDVGAYLPCCTSGAITTMDWLDPHLCKLVYSSVIAVVSICGQFTTVIMATEPNTATVVPAEPKAQWNVAETNALLDHLLSNKSEVGDGGFKPSTFTSAATALARANLLTAGPPKTNKRCRSKWNMLRGIYREIQNYRNISGAHWDNTKGAGIEGRTALEVFNNYVTSSLSTVI
ncbi:hypothetical protein F4604DRAFT_1674887 [Suillus subluteus]|nr:hypothetical protein F4604DRAFT_1674887 [Suillus subluteus]